MMPRAFTQLHFVKTLFRVPPWLRHYRRADFSQDILAGLLVGILVIPQSLGYAMLAGLPPIYGLYSAVVPVLVYAWIGSSSVNAVGPVAVTALMTAQALQPYQHLPPAQYAALAALLALFTGIMLFVAGVCRLGWVTRFISRGVNAGFITAASVLIFISQIKFLTAVPIGGNTLPDSMRSFAAHAEQLHTPTLLLGVAAVGLLWLNRYCLDDWLKQAFRLPEKPASLIRRVFPLAVMVGAIALSMALQFEQHGIRTIHSIPKGRPHWAWPFQVQAAWLELLPAAALTALVAFVSSQAVAANFARKRGQPFDADEELLGLGLANMIGAFFQSFTVVGGFSRTALNVDSGAQTPLASVVSVVVMLAALTWLTTWLEPLPYAVLAANIMVAIVGLMDIATLKEAWRRDRLDAWAYLATLAAVLLFGLNIGLVAGILISFGALIWQAGHPHMAVVGEVGDSGHFRNIKRHQVVEHSGLVIVRIDESLFYGNAAAVRGYLDKVLARYPECRHLVLMCSAVNYVDLSAQEMLTDLNNTLQQQGIILHYSEIKGPVMDILQHTDVIKSLSGQVFLSTHAAVKTLGAKSGQIEYMI